MSQRPLVVALLLCEQVIVDAKTKRFTPVNCFWRWLVEGSLSEPQSFHVVALLSSGHGTMAGALTIDRLDTGETIFRREFLADFVDPVEQYRCMIRLRRVQFPVANVYEAILTVDGENIASNRFSVLLQE